MVQDVTLSDRVRNKLLSNGSPFCVWELHSGCFPDVSNKDITELLEQHPEFIAEDDKWLHTFDGDEVVYWNDGRDHTTKLRNCGYELDVTIFHQDEAADFTDITTDVDAVETEEKLITEKDVTRYGIGAMKTGDLSTGTTSVGYENREFSFTVNFTDDEETPVDVLHDVADTVEAKDDDYGNAIEKVALIKSLLAADDIETLTEDSDTYVKLGEHSPDGLQQQRLDGIFTRLLDKVARLYNLSFNKDEEDVSESRRETAEDLIGYLSHAAINKFGDS